MRLNRFLNEEKNPILEMVEKRCGPFLRDLKGTHNKYLLSGRERKKSWFIGEVRKNRIPRDTSIELHKKADDIFKEVFGIRARSNTLFCISNEEKTSLYGYTYLIFPIGKYEIIWSRKIEDFYEYFTIKHGLETRENEDFIRETIEEEYEDGNLKDALKSGNEIMLYCDKYYAFSLLQWMNDIREWLLG